MSKIDIRPTAILVLIFAFALTGCAKQPKPAAFQFSHQKQVQAAHHWEILVGDLTKEIEKSEKLSSKINGPLTLIPNDKSQFTKAFRSFLTTYFVNSDVILNDSANNFKLDWSIQLVEHKTDRGIDQTPGSFTASSALGYGVYKIWDKNSSSAAGLFGTAIAMDIAKEFIDSEFVNVPHSEIIINITLLDTNNNMLYRKSNTYYINDLDRSQYSFTPDIQYKKAETKQYAISD